MNPRFRLLYITFFVLLAVNNAVLSQSENTLPKQAETNTLNGTSTNTSFSRILIKFPMPEYTISDSGVVIVIVRINKNGRIINAKVDKIKSTTQNKMLYNSALKAAIYAKYNSIDKDTVETGQLTYTFKLK
jgi:TonB family protein